AARRGGRARRPGGRRGSAGQRLKLLQDVAHGRHLVGVRREVAPLERVIGRLVVLVRLGHQVGELGENRRRDYGRGVVGRGRGGRGADELWYRRRRRGGRDGARLG